MDDILSEPSAADRARLETTRGLAKVARVYAVEGVEVRAVEDTPHLRDFYGHAAVTDKSYEMYGGPEKGGWDEFVDGGAFKRTLGIKPEVKFVVNHAGMPMASTKSKDLRLHLREDPIGLEAKARLDTRVSFINDAVILMEAGVINEMSFAFRVKGQTWLDADGEEVPYWDLAGIERHITEVDLQKGDVSIVTYGANPFTDAAVRNLDDTIRDLIDGHEVDEAMARRAVELLTPLTVTEPEVRAVPASYYTDLGRLLATREQPAA